MTAFGWVPRARVWPCARWVEAKTSPSSIAWQTPTATASWPMATWRKPGSSPARKRSSTFSSNRLIRSISRRNSRSRSSERPRLASTFAIDLTESMLRPMALVDQWLAIEDGLPEGWESARLRLIVSDRSKAERAAALLGPATPGRYGSFVTFNVAKRGGGPSPNLVRRLLARLEAEGMAGNLDLVGLEERPA